MEKRTKEQVEEQIVEAHKLADQISEMLSGHPGGVVLVAAAIVLARASAFVVATGADPADLQRVVNKVIASEHDAIVGASEAGGTLITFPPEEGKPN